MRTDELRSQANAYAALKDHLIAVTGLDADDDCLADTLEGLSDLNEIIIRAAREAKEAEAMADAVKAIMAENSERRQRFLTKADRIRAAIAHAMQDAGLPKITAPDMTISQRAGKVAPKIVDADALPDWAKVEKIVVSPDRDAIREAFDEDPAGFSCPGVIVPNAEPVLTVRMK
jgi:hypothetical protein